MSVLLINPWINDFTAFNLWARPAGLLRIARMLQVNDIEFKYLDMLDGESFHSEIKYENVLKTKINGTFPYERRVIEKPVEFSNVKRRYYSFGLSKKELFCELENMDFKIIIVNSMMTYWYRSSSEIISILREKYPGAYIISGGIYPTLMKKHAEENLGADEIIDNYKDVLLRIREKLDINSPRVQEYYDRLPVELYRTNSFVPLYTSFGCPLNCPYCASSKFYSKYFQRGHSEILSEIEYYYSLGIRKIAFYDDALLYRSKKHFLPLTEKLSGKFSNLEFYSPNGLSVSQLGEEEARALKNINLKEARLALETADESLQNEMGAKADKREFETGFNNLIKAGFIENEIKVYLLAGLPGQTYESVLKSIEYVKSFGIVPSLSEYSPVPGTVSFEESCKITDLPLEYEPLYHNRIMLPASTELTSENITKLKILAKK